MSRILLYAFRYKSPVTGKWVKARYVAELREIRERYAEFELIGEPELREPGAEVGELQSIWQTGRAVAAPR